MALDMNEYLKIQLNCMELAKMKSRLYGTNSLKSFKGLGILARIEDKFSRIKNIVENEIKYFESEIDDFESVEDNLMDIINYAIYYLMLKRGKLENGKEKTTTGKK